MVAVCRFIDRDMMMRYHWGRGVGHIYAFTSDLGQEKLVGDNDGDIGDGKKTCDTTEVDDRSGDDESDNLSWWDDGEQENGNISGTDSEDDSDEENQYLVDAMYDSDSNESSWDREYSF